MHFIFMQMVLQKYTMTVMHSYMHELVSVTSTKFTNVYNYKMFTDLNQMPIQGQGNIYYLISQALHSLIS